MIFKYSKKRNDLLTSYFELALAERLTTNLKRSYQKEFPEEVVDKKGNKISC